MLIAYWIVAALLSVAYLAAGVPKIVSTPEKLLERGQTWVRGVNPAIPQVVGALEVLGVLGLILPPLFHTAVFLAPTAAVGLVLVQAVAIGIHLKAGETKALPVNIVLLVLALAAAWLGVLAL